MKTIKIKVLKKALKDAEERGIKEIYIKSYDQYFDFEKIIVSDITGICIYIKK